MINGFRNLFTILRFTIHGFFKVSKIGPPSPLFSERWRSCDHGREEAAIRRVGLQIEVFKIVMRSEPGA